MYRDEERYVYPVSTQDVATFANVLFCRLYYAFDLYLESRKRGPHYSEEMARAVLLVQRNSSRFNNQFLSHCSKDISRLSLCTKIIQTYPGRDYFKKLYYTTAFILEVILIWNSEEFDVDLSEGPNIWIDIFQNEFESEFESNGGWRGLKLAGNSLLQRADERGIIPLNEVIKPDYFMCVCSGVPLINTLPVDPDAVMDDVEQAIGGLNISPEQQVQHEVGVQVGEPQVEVAQVEDPEKAEDDPPAEQVGENLDLPPGAVGGNLNLLPGAVGGNLDPPGAVGGVLDLSPGAVGENLALPPGAVGGNLGERRRRKRRHGAGPSDSDAEQDDSLSPSKAKLDRSTTG